MTLRLPTVALPTGATPYTGGSVIGPRRAPPGQAEHGRTGHVRGMFQAAGASMKQQRIRRCVRLAAGSACLAAEIACVRHAAPAIDAERAQTASADSVRSARAERNRSSATQAVVFTEDARRRFTRVEQMIQARVSGVRVVPRGSGFTIQIRGKGSVGSSTEPLVVIDGAPRSTVDLAGVDPKEVERIEVIKDAAAAYYGVRGANGVLVITTRRTR
jgi:TonB-dependent SusC/RagA subfamily outer membrane receptor